MKKINGILKKSLWYRITALLLTFGIFFLYTGELLATTKWVFLIETAHTLLYLCFEYLYKRFDK